MPLHWWYHGPDGDDHEAETGVQKMTTAVTSHAQEVSIGTSTLPVDDRVFDTAMRGHRLMWAIVDEAADYGTGIVYAGFTGSRDITRGEVPLEREWGIQLVDPNTIPERRLLLGEDANRGAEWDYERIAWVFGTDEMSLITGTDLISTDSPVMMSAADYRKRRPADVIRDCMEHSGKNCYISFEDGDGNRPAFWVWYGHKALDVYDSGIRMTNALADVDDETTFYIAYDTKLNRDPSRVASGCLVNYDGGWVYVTNPATAEHFAVGGRDVTIEAAHIRDAATAKARGLRHLRDLATEDDVITTAILVSPAQANIVREGHLVEIKLTHIGDYSDWTPMRVIHRTFRQLAPEEVLLGLDLVPIDRAPSGGVGLYGILYEPHGPFKGGWGVWFTSTGDDPVAPGEQPRPTVGLIEAIVDSDPQDAARPYEGWKITGTGTVDVAFDASVVAVFYTTHVVTWSILLNGTAVAQETEEVAVTGLSGRTARALVTVDALAVVPDDVITAEVRITPTPYNVKVPAGVGQGGNRLEISGGTLV